MTGPLIIEVWRGPHVESRHLVDVAVVDAGGSVVESRGDATRMVLPRSALKPVQSSSIISSGAADAFALTDPQVAIACASHGGEPLHVHEIDGWLDVLDLDRDALECGAHPPTHAPSAAALIRDRIEFDARHNNCSGKHCGFLAICRHVGLPPEGYIGASHPLQRDHVTPAIEHWCEISLRGQEPAIDGCGIPVWPMALDRLARGWAALGDDAVGRRIFDAMVAEPEMVAGTGRVCTRLIQAGAGRVVVKTGAEGVYCAIDRSTGLAVALKVHDGATRAGEMAIEWALARLGALPPVEPRLLRNWTGTVVGAVRVIDWRTGARTVRGRCGAGTFSTFTHCVRRTTQMKTRAAILREVDADWNVEEIELDDPQPGEILVKTLAAGMCHSDEHAHNGSMPVPMPLVGGHEGAGEVLALGPGVSEFEVGDHVSCSFIPSCGKCSFCASGQQNLCDLGAHLLEPGMMAGGFRHHSAAGEDLTPLLKLGTFAEHMVLSVDSAIKIDKDVPAGPAALVSCGVTTGYGSAVNRAEVTAGDTVVIVGCGGVGTGAIQGAKIAGAKNVVAIDPSEFKRESAMTFGATHSAASMEEAMELVGGMTLGVMADSVILTPGVLTGDLIAPAQFLTRKGGTIVATAVAPAMQMDVQLNLFEFAMMNKQLKGCLFGSASPRKEIPHLLSMYQAGQLMLDEMITNTYTLDEINEGYADMTANKNVRGIITFD